MTKAVCIIPARGGSKRIPRKNTLMLGDKPLVAHTVDAAVKSGCFDKVFVSSDDDEILSISEQFGAIPDRRPDHLSGDTIKAVEVIREFLARDGFAGFWDTVAMCLPTCPLRTSGDVKEAMEIFAANHQDCPRLLGVTKMEPPQLALKRIDEGHLMDMREPDAYSKTTRSQDMDVFYRPNGAIYVATVEEFRQAGTFFKRPMLTYVMPEARSLDIDEPYQFALVEAMLAFQAKQ